jgi:hypothetical protein
MYTVLRLVRVVADDFVDDCSYLYGCARHATLGIVLLRPLQGAAYSYHGYVTVCRGQLGYRGGREVKCTCEICLHLFR